MKSFGTGDQLNIMIVGLVWTNKVFTLQKTVGVFAAVIEAAAAGAVFMQWTPDVLYTYPANNK
jgi:hypothetical protein